MWGIIIKCKTLSTCCRGQSGRLHSCRSTGLKKKGQNSKVMARCWLGALVEKILQLKILPTNQPTRVSSKDASTKKDGKRCSFLSRQTGLLVSHPSEIIFMCSFLVVKILCFLHLNFNSTGVRNNANGVAGPQCQTAGLAEHIVLTPWSLIRTGGIK